MNKPWFGPKRIGVGISPVSWEGWICALAFIALLAALPAIFQMHKFWFSTVAVCAVPAFCYVIYKTYDGKREK